VRVDLPAAMLPAIEMRKLSMLVLFLKSCRS
jgi:hypothetical protein